MRPEILEMLREFCEVNPYHFKNRTTKKRLKDNFQKLPLTKETEVALDLLNKHLIKYWTKNPSNFDFGPGTLLYMVNELAQDNFEDGALSSEEKRVLSKFLEKMDEKVLALLDSVLNMLPNLVAQFNLYSDLIYSSFYEQERRSIGGTATKEN